jgi:hypothetical protein
MLFAAASAAGAQSDPRVYTPRFDDEGSSDVPHVQVWLENRSLDNGDVIRPYVTSDPGAYLTIVRVTTDGQLQILYPYQPREQAPYNPARFSNDRVPMTGGSGFVVRESTGNGFIFAIASYYRFNYSYYSSRGYWSATRLASASRFGTPFQIVRSFVEEITEGSSSYSMDYVMYNVDGRSYRSRYASRYRNYAYGDYYDLCLNAFDRYYYSYCGGYGGYYNPYIVTHLPAQPKGKTLRGRPIVHDPMLPHPQQPVIGHFPAPEPSEARTAARRERMLRDARPRVEQRTETNSAPRIYRPPSEPSVSRPIQRSEPRSEPRPIQRSEPRAEPRVEHRRIDPPREHPRAEPARVAPPPKDNQ